MTTRPSKVLKHFQWVKRSLSRGAVGSQYSDMWINCYFSKGPQWMGRLITAKSNYKKIASFHSDQPPAFRQRAKSLFGKIYILSSSFLISPMRRGVGRGKQNKTKNPKQNNKKSQTKPNKNFYSCYLKYEADILFKGNQPDELLKMAQ